MALITSASLTSMAPSIHSLTTAHVRSFMWPRNPSHIVAGPLRAPSSRFSHGQTLERARSGALEGKLVLGQRLRADWRKRTRSAVEQCHTMQDQSAPQLPAT